MSEWLNRCGLNWRWWATTPVVIGIALPIAILTSTVNVAADALDWLRRQIRWHIDTPISKRLMRLMKWARHTSIDGGSDGG